METIEIAPIAGDADLSAARALMREYARGIGFDLGFQRFEEELADLRRVYAPPGGRLLLAKRQGVAVGCVALRRLDESTCELKRMFVLARLRGLGLGRRLVDAALAAARAKGYRTVRLDTVPGMAAAIALYRSLGFVEIAPYCHNPQPGALFMELDLSAPASRPGTPK